MVFTTVGKSGTVLAIGSFSSNRPQYMAIGTGSAAESVDNVALQTETDRKAFASVAVDTINNEITYTANWNSVAISGTSLTEFGIFTPASAGSLWDREGFGAISFDGTNELQIELVLRHV